MRGHDVKIERQSLLESVPAARLTSPSGETSEIVMDNEAPGLFSAHFTARRQGLYRVEQGELIALVNVGPENPLEYRQAASSTELLTPLARATGGSVRRIGRAGDAEIVLPRLVVMERGSTFAGADYIGLRRTGASLVKGVELEPLAVGAFGLLALLGALVAAWIYEGRRAKSAQP